MKGMFTGAVWDDNETITVNEGKVYWPIMGWQWNNNGQWRENLLARYGMTIKQ